MHVRSSAALPACFPQIFSSPPYASAVYLFRKGDGRCIPARVPNIRPELNKLRQLPAAGTKNDQSADQPAIFADGLRMQKLYRLLYTAVFVFCTCLLRPRLQGKVHIRNSRRSNPPMMPSPHTVRGGILNRIPPLLTPLPPDRPSGGCYQYTRGFGFHARLIIS